MEILKYCRDQPRDYTYLGVGSKNRYDDLEKFTSEIDQILPPFLNTLVGKTIRVIHFDEEFSKNPDFLQEYFNSKGFVPDGYYMWRTPDFKIEVIIKPVNLTDINFYQKIVNQTVEMRTQLVVQEYTGRELIDRFKTIYLNANPTVKAYIRDNILFDFTYGTACNCETPMLEYYPIVDNYGKFYNFTLYRESEIPSLIGLHPKIDKLIEICINKKLSSEINNHHVNYRKAIRGEPFLFPTHHYPMNASPDEIMNLLLKNVSEMLNNLQRLGKLTVEKKELFDRYSKNYKNIDMYKWYSDMTKLYK